MMQCRTAPDPSRSIASFSDVWRYWGRGKSRWAVLKGVELDVPAGTVTQVEGSNGAGKTTLLRIATGILAPHAGSVRVDGIDMKRNWREYHRRIGFLSAGDRGLYPRLDVQGHLEYIARVSFIDPSLRAAAITAAIQDFGLRDLVRRRSERMSQGQRQRLRLALTFMHRPRLLLLDEPRNSLDADGIELLVRAVNASLAGGAGVVWACPTGEQQPVRFDRSFRIHDGHLIAQH